MAARYAPLVFPTPLEFIPQYFQSKITLYDGTSPVTSQWHVEKMNDCFDLQEVDEESVKLRMFSQSLRGEVRKWLKYLYPNSINEIPTFHQIFLKRWEVKKTLFRFYINRKTLGGP